MTGYLTITAKRITETETLGCLTGRKPVKKRSWMRKKLFKNKPRKLLQKRTELF